MGQVYLPGWTRFPASAIAGYGSRPSRVTILIWHAAELRPVDSHVVLMTFIIAILLNWPCIMRVSLATNLQRKASSDVPSPSNCPADCQQTSFRAWEASLFQRCYLGESALPIRCNTSFRTLGQCSLVRAACHSCIGVELVLVARFGARRYLIHFMRVVGSGRQFGYAPTPSIEINGIGGWGLEWPQASQRLSWHGFDPRKVRPYFNGFAVRSW